MLLMKKQLFKDFLGFELFKAIVVFVFKIPSFTALGIVFTLLFSPLFTVKASEQQLIVIEGTVVTNLSGFYVTKQTHQPAQTSSSCDVLIVNQALWHNTSSIPISPKAKRKSSKTLQNTIIAQKKQNSTRHKLVFQKYKSENVFKQTVSSCATTTTNTFKVKKQLLVKQVDFDPLTTVYSAPRKEFMTKDVPQFSPKEKHKRYFSTSPPALAL